MFVYLYVESSIIKNVLWILVKIETNKVWIPVSIEDQKDFEKAQIAMLRNKLGNVRQSKVGYSFFIKLLNLNTSDLKIDADSAELVSLSAMSIKRSVKRLDDVLTSVMQDNIQIALSDIMVKLDPPNSDNETDETSGFDVIISSVDLSDGDFKRSAIRNGGLDLDFVGTVDFKDYTKLDHLVHKALTLVGEENKRINNHISFSEFEKRLNDGKVQLVLEKR